MSNKRINFNSSMLGNFISKEELDNYVLAIENAEAQLQNRSGKGADFLGWLDLPSKIERKCLNEITDKAEELREKADTLICIGIGGSYLGARAAIEFLLPTFDNLRKTKVIFAGHCINSDYIYDLLESVKDSSVAINVISKSGTTTEPAIAFRIIREWMEKKYGKKEAAARIVATTDSSKGALRKLATEEGYSTFSIPSDVGGRFSVLTPVGLFPIAFAGISIYELIEGAQESMNFCKGKDISINMAGHYAAIRNILFRKGYIIEVLSSFQPQLHFVGEWWKQLSGESEGKNNTGIFPASLDFTTDLHSLGQWMQEGLRNVFETFIILKNTNQRLTIPHFTDDSDELGYLEDISFEEINNNAFKGTLLAHNDGGVPCSVLTLEDRTPRTLGQLFYFFEKAIALSGYILRVNPFDQPGVEAYKKNMFALLGKKGYEELGKTLNNRIKGINL